MKELRPHSHQREEKIEFSQLYQPLLGSSPQYDTAIDIDREPTPLISRPQNNVSLITKLPNEILETILKEMLLGDSSFAERKNNYLPSVCTHFFFSTRTNFPIMQLKLHTAISQLQKRLNDISLALEELNKPQYKNLKAFCSFGVLIPLLLACLIIAGVVYVANEKEKTRENFVDAIAPDNKTCIDHGMSQDTYNIISSGSTKFKTFCNYTTIQLCVKLCNAFGEESLSYSDLMKGAAASGLFLLISFGLWKENRSHYTDKKKRNVITNLEEALTVEEINTLKRSDLDEIKLFLNKSKKETEVRLKHDMTLLNLHMRKASGYEALNDNRKTDEYSSDSRSDTPETMPFLR